MAQSRPCHLQQRPSQFFKLRYPASGTVGPKGGDFKSTKTKSCGSSHAALHCMESKSFSITSGSFRSNHAACLRSNSLKNSALQKRQIIYTDNKKLIIFIDPILRGHILKNKPLFNIFCNYLLNVIIKRFNIKDLLAQIRVPKMRLLYNQIINVVAITNIDYFTITLRVI